MPPNFESLRNRALPIAATLAAAGGGGVAVANTVEAPNQTLSPEPLTYDIGAIQELSPFDPSVTLKIGNTKLTNAHTYSINQGSEVAHQLTTFNSTEPFGGVSFIEKNTPQVKRDKKTIEKWYSKNPEELVVGKNNVHTASSKNFGKLKLRIINESNRYFLSVSKGAKILGAYVRTYDFEVREGVVQRAYSKVVRLTKNSSSRKYTFAEKADSDDTTKSYQFLSVLLKHTNK